jgi:tetratricopeptide (TPR) repeat protein
VPAGAQAALLHRADQAYWRGELDQARRDCLAVLERAPQDVAALSLMANIAADLRQLDEGLRWAAQAVAADSGAAAPHYALGRLHDLAGRPAEAEASFRRVVALDPGNAKAHNNLGRALSLQGRLDEALACYLRALQLDPDQPEANQNYAAMSNDPAARESAIRGFLRQTTADPTDARAFANLASVYAGSGRHGEALASLERAIAIDSEYAEAHYSRGTLLLATGDYAEGWKEYQWRWRINNPYSKPARRFPEPFWDGNPVAGAVLMHGELAFGESLQFVRYARLVAERCSGVLFECAAPLKPLLQEVGGVRQAIAPQEPLPPFAAHIALFALPRVFGTTLQNIPWDGPYVRADPEKAAQWRRVLDARGPKRFRVGLVWTGNPQNPNNRDRSVPPALLGPLSSAPGVELYSLQKDAMAPGFDTPPAALALADLTPQLRDFSDTAAFVACLDLVISIDTAVAHLAGAMGRPVWVLLNHVPDWRYHLERADNPWYPGMRLFRQAREDQWAEVIDRVAAELRAAAAASAGNR